ncbi:hypothetical protein MMC12_008524 [Toensbergia leucococca]|nr:hypothetical protein [Toensbergia leucococca]
MASPTDPYAEVHKSPNGHGDARPTALQIIHDEDLSNKMTDKVMFVTGSSSGIGIETVRALHATGARIFMQVRDMKKGEDVMRDILASSKGTGGIELVKMDLDSFESIRTGAAEFLKRSDTLNVLVNNAGRHCKTPSLPYANAVYYVLIPPLGVRNTPEGRTQDGFETQFGTNHLAHFLLFQLLRPVLLSSSTPSFASRVINLTSGSHRSGPMHFDNLNLKGIYTPRLAYAQSKTANILMANQIERVYGARGLHALAVQPGAIRTGLQKYDDPVEFQSRLTPELLKIEKSQAQGAATTVWAAVGKVWEGKGAKYLEDMRAGQPADQPGILSGGYKEYAFDEEAEKRLWEVSRQMVGMNDTE